MMSSGKREPSFIEQARRRQIIDATIETIAELGLAKASNAAIAARAGMSPALINYHFGSRGELIGHMRATLQQRVDAAMDPETEDDGYTSALNGMLRRFAAHCLDNLPEMLVLTQLDRQEQAADYVREAERAKGLDELSAFIEEGQRHGQFRAIDARLFASVLLNAMTQLPQEIRQRHEANRSVFEYDWPKLFVNSIAVTREDEHGNR